MNNTIYSPFPRSPGDRFRFRNSAGFKGKLSSVNALVSRQHKTVKEFFGSGVIVAPQNFAKLRHQKLKLDCEVVRFHARLTYGIEECQADP